MGSKTVIGRMREIPIRDDVVRNATLRPDGRMVHDFYVFRVKTPTESTGEWDYYDPVATLAGPDAFRPLAAGVCPAIAK